MWGSILILTRKYILGRSKWCVHICPVMSVVLNWNRTRPCLCTFPNPWLRPIPYRIEYLIFLRPCTEQFNYQTLNDVWRCASDHQAAPRVTLSRERFWTKFWHSQSGSNGFGELLVWKWKKGSKKGKGEGFWNPAEHVTDLPTHRQAALHSSHLCLRCVTCWEKIVIKWQK